MTTRQKYPHSVIKVGTVIYSAIYFIDEKTGKAKTEIWDWVVRSIRKKRGSQTKYGYKRFGNGDDSNYVNLIIKRDGITWGKLSTKNGDYGWLTIPSWAREQFRVGSDLPYGKYTTKRAALKHAKTELEEEIEWYKKEIEKDTECEVTKHELQENIEMLASVTRAISRLK